jgi:nicotinate-nucleotide pyrophosphorylase (carboxylating)
MERRLMSSREAPALPVSPIRPARKALPPRSAWCPLVERALEEDVGPGDITTELTIPAGLTGGAQIEARQSLVVCGLDVAREVFFQVDPELGFEARVRDGDAVDAGTVLVDLTGSVRSILVGERTALNFAARLCGIASHSARFVEAVAGTGTAIVDTRKTLPGWRVLDKYAAATGGAVNHRTGLFDGILLKDNHIAAAGGVGTAVRGALAHAPAGLRVQVEVQSLEEALEAIDAGADFLLLDNCTPDRIREIVDRCHAGVLLESSGGVDLTNVRAHAEAGVHRVSIGALTHSAPSADLALEMTGHGGNASGPGAGSRRA